MFIGHFGIGMAAKKVVPGVSLGMLFLSAQLLDLLWPTFLLLGWEHVVIEPGNTKMTPLNFTDYPISHSLLMACVWGLLTGIVYFIFRKNTRAAVVVGLLVVSHWVLDLVVHAQDLPLFPWASAKAGFGLWGYPAIESIIEGTIFIGGIVLYLKTTRAGNSRGKYIFWSLVIFLAVIHIMNMVGPPPPNVGAIAWAGQLQWLFIFWAHWAEKNRDTIG